MRFRATKTYYDSELYQMQEHPEKRAMEIGKQVPYHLKYMREMKKDMRIELIEGYHIAEGNRYVLMRDYGSHTRVLAHTDTLEEALKKFLSLYQVDLLTDMGHGMFDYIKSIEEGNKKAVQVIKRVLEGAYGKDINRKSN